MIIQIALGIVLAVLILVFLPEILAFGLVAVLITAGLAVIAAVLHWGFPLLAQNWIAVLYVALLLGGLFVIHLLLERYSDALRLSPKLERIVQIFGFTLIALITVSLWIAGAAYFYWAFSLPDEEIIFRWFLPAIIVPALLVPAVIALTQAYIKVFGLSSTMERTVNNLQAKFRRLFPWRNERKRRKSLGYDDSSSS